MALLNSQKGTRMNREPDICPVCGSLMELHPLISGEQCYVCETCKKAWFLQTEKNVCSVCGQPTQQEHALCSVCLTSTVFDFKDDTSNIGIYSGPEKPIVVPFPWGPKKENKL